MSDSVSGIWNLLNRAEGLKYEEIALRLNISRNTVKVHLHQARKIIRQYLSTHNLRGILFWCGLLPLLVNPSLLSGSSTSLVIV